MLTGSNDFESNTGIKAKRGEREREKVGVGVCERERKSWSRRGCVIVREGK